ncbi:MAG: hypothetical protein ABI474_08430, partial [Actinomycetota bacterium]
LLGMGKDVVCQVLLQAWHIRGRHTELIHLTPRQVGRDASRHSGSIHSGNINVARQPFAH